MDLPQALYVINSFSHLRGVSDAAVATRANTHLAHSSAHPVPHLDGGLVDRLADLLLNLAYATRLSYQPTVFDVYQQWAIARYLGAFDLSSTHKWNNTVELSEAGSNVFQNQRRVLSEDLGIGASVLLAKRWAQVNFPYHDVHLVDIDVAINKGIMTAPPGRRADYVLLAYDGVSRSASALGVLECKGSESKNHSLQQIEDGAPQVEETTFTGRRLGGLVSSLHSGRDEVVYYVAEIRPDGVDDRVDVPLEGSASDLFGVSWARLADVADEPGLYERFAPEALKRRRPTSSIRTQASKERFTVGGVPYVGTEARIPLPGGELRYFLGADERVISSLQRDDTESALQTKWQFGSRAQTLDRPEPLSGPEYVETASSDGLALVLRLT